MHLQLNASLKVPNVLNDYTPLKKIHFPTSRISLEAVIRLLAEEFRVPCADEPNIWRPMLTESESLFKGIAHEAPSGPAS